MRSSLLVAVISAIKIAPAQYGHQDHPGAQPYRPFPPKYHWTPKRPSSSPYHSNREPVVPKVKNIQVLGLVSDPALDRDSCGSVPFGDRIFWTCRDTQLFYPNGSVKLDPLITSTGSWSDFDSTGGPLLQDMPEGADPLHTVIMRQYGENSIERAFFPVTDAFCGDPAGGCRDGTRYAMWPDLPPLVTQSNDQGMIAYTWIRESHIRSDLSDVTINPATALYRTTHTPNPYGLPSSRSILPKVTIISQTFWAPNEIPFGNYGNLIKDNTAYLFARANGSTSLAKVPAQQIETKSAYTYWVNGAWTADQPTLGQDGINITNANAQGQGTYFFSEPWQSYVWIGGGPDPVADMYITTAPDPTGPWIVPRLFYRGVVGSYYLGAYSVQAHPGLVRDPWDQAVYVTYTKNDVDGEGASVYSTPLVYVEWES